MPPDWITVKEAADIMGVSTSLVLKYAQLGKIAAYKPGRHWMVSYIAAHAFKRQRKPKTRKSGGRNPRLPT